MRSLQVTILLALLWCNTGIAQSACAQQDTFLVELPLNDTLRVDVGKWQATAEDQKAMHKGLRIILKLRNRGSQTMLFPKSLAHYFDWGSKLRAYEPVQIRPGQSALIPIDLHLRIRRFEVYYSEGWGWAVLLLFPIVIKGEIGPGLYNPTEHR